MTSPQDRDDFRPYRSKIINDDLFHKVRAENRTHFSSSRSSQQAKKKAGRNSQPASSGSASTTLPVHPWSVPEKNPYEREMGMAAGDIKGGLGLFAGGVCGWAGSPVADGGWPAGRRSMAWLALWRPCCFD
jgi:hypothetical protein